MFHYSSTIRSAKIKVPSLKNYLRPLFPDIDFGRVGTFDSGVGLGFLSEGITSGWVRKRLRRILSTRSESIPGL